MSLAVRQARWRRALEALFVVASLGVCPAAPAASTPSSQRALPVGTTPVAPAVASAVAPTLTSPSTSRAPRTPSPAPAPGVTAGAASAAGARDRPGASRPQKGSAFGPFDAGAPRPVTRQGVSGRARRAHPMVGAPGKVPGDGPPAAPLRADPDIPELALTSPNALGGVGLSSSPLWLAALTYQHLLTRLDGPRCQHLPTCSRFASQAVARHGAVGIWMGLDRIIQVTESSALRRLPEVEGWGGLRGFDPVENYEFWKQDRFSGFPQPVAEEPLVLPPLTTDPSHADAPRGAHLP